MTKIFVGVDGGGSKTATVLVDEYGQVLGRGVAAGSNYQTIGLDAALQNLRDSLQSALLAAGLAPNLRPHAAIIGLAGIDRPADQAVWQDKLALADHIEFCSDADLLFYALPQHVGLGLIAGTGSIALGRDSTGKRVRAGGWGHFLGDEGGGVWLGRAVLNAATRASDGRGPQTLLLPMLLGEWQLSNATELIAEIYTPSGIDNARIARLAELVFRAVDAGDDFAQTLLQAAAYELALAVKTCQAQLEFPTAPALALTGGLLLNHPMLQTALNQQLGNVVGQLITIPDPALIAAQSAIQ